MHHEHVFKALVFDLLTTSPRVVGERGSAVKLFATMLLNFVTMLLKTLTFGPPKNVEGGGLGANYLLPCCCIS